MKKYRIKKEYKHLFENGLSDIELFYDCAPTCWIATYNIGLEALEEVPQRIKLYREGNSIRLNAYICPPDKQKELMEKALNGELLDFETVVGFMKWNDNEMMDCDYDVFESTFKRYLKQR